MGKIKLPPAPEKKAWLDKWLARQTNFKKPMDKIVAQGDYMTELMYEADCPLKWDVTKTNAIYEKWMAAKESNILTFRDKTYTSVHTGVKSLHPKTPWIKNFDFSIKGWLKNVVTPEEAPIPLEKASFFEI